MQGFEHEKFIFYTAGKIGTRTLMFTDGIKDLTEPRNITGSLRRKTLEIIIKQKEITGKQIVILIREPVSRLNSGLFELIGKVLGGPYLRQIISQGGDISFIENPTFWNTVIEQCLRFSSRSWSPHKEFESHRWQYHIGNWLLDAETISEIFTDSIILNIKDLSNFLVSNGIPDSHRNPSSNIIPWNYIRDSNIIPKNYDTTKMVDAFLQGLELLPNRVSQINNYLAPEKECYERLINSPQYYKVG